MSYGRTDPGCLEIGLGCGLALLALGIPLAFWGFWGWFAVQLLHHLP